jgi:hypothetical protein
VFWPLWPVAMVWASWSPRRRQRPKVHVRISPARAKVAVTKIPIADETTIPPVQAVVLSGAAERAGARCRTPARAFPADYPSILKSSCATRLMKWVI